MAEPVSAVSETVLEEDGTTDYPPRPQPTAKASEESAPFPDDDEEQESSCPSDNQLPPDMNEFWKAFLKIFEKKELVLPSFLMRVSLSINGNECVLTFPGSESFPYSQVSQKENVATIAKAFSAFVGRPMSVKTVLDRNAVVPATTESSDAPKPKARRASKFDLEADIEKEPVIKSILEIFDGELV